jgi:hypothetical protein
MQIKLTLNKRQVGPVLDALEMYGRLGMGELSTLLDHPVFVNSNNKTHIESILEEIKGVFFKDIKEQGRYYSIGSSKVKDQFKVSFDIFSVIMKETNLANNQSSVWTQDITQRGSLPLITCEITKEETILTMDEEHMNVLNKAFEVYYRLGMGQTDILEDVLNTNFQTLSQSEHLLIGLELKNTVYPEFKHIGTSYGASAYNIPVECRLICDIKNVIDYSYATVTDPQQIKFALHRKPINRSGIPLANCLVSK